MGLYVRINEDLKVAMKAGEKEKVGIYRMLLSEIKRTAIDQNMRDDINDDLVIAALTRGMKSRKESVEQYRAGGREDLATKEEAEIGLIAAYLPKPFTEQELDAFIDAAVVESGACGRKDLGKVMKVVISEVKGRADGKVVQRKVVERLTALED